MIDIASPENAAATVELVKAALEWGYARHDFLVLPAASSKAKAALDRLSRAEERLFAATGISKPHQFKGTP